MISRDKKQILVMWGYVLRNSINFNIKYHNVHLVWLYSYLYSLYSSHYKQGPITTKQVKLSFLYSGYIFRRFLYFWKKKEPSHISNLFCFVSADVHTSRYDQAIFGTAQFGQDIYINVVDNKRWKTCITYIPRFLCSGS